jgi:phage terminase small subunit
MGAEPANERNGLIMLNPRQKRFVALYLESLNASDACRRAGYEAKSARKTGSRLLHTPEIRQVIDEAMDARAKEHQVTQERILKELFFSATARLDMFELDENGNVTTKPGVPREALAAVSSVRRRTTLDFDGKTREQSTTITLLDKPKALSLAMRFLGILHDKLEVTTGEEAARKMIAEAADNYEKRLELLAARVCKKENGSAVN